MVAAAVAAEATDLVRAVILEDPPFDTMGARIRSYPLYPYFVALESLAGGATDLLERMIADVTRVRVRGIGHQIHVAATDTALRIALDFLESLQN